MLSAFDSFEKTLITWEDSVSMTYTGIYRRGFEISISSHWTKGEHVDLWLWIFTCHSFQNDSAVDLLWIHSPYKCWIDAVQDQNTKIFSKQTWYLIVQIWTILVPISAFYWWVLLPIRFYSLQILLMWIAVFHILVLHRNPERTSWVFWFPGTFTRLLWRESSALSWPQSWL